MAAWAASCKLKSVRGPFTEDLFISYRRDDSAAYAGRICDHLTSLIGDRRVFMDVEDINPGQNFAEAIDQTLTHCSTVFVVIGPRWQEILTARGALPGEDYVVHEIAAALKRQKTVVPVFVGGAQPASLTALPPELADLSFHQAVELRDASFKDDCERLAKSLHLARAPSPFLRRALLWSLPALAAFVLLLFGAANAGVGPWRDWHARKILISQLFNTAATQIAQAEYESAFQSYQQIVTLQPDNRAALDGQVEAAGFWLENFHVLGSDGQKPEDVAAPLLAKLKPVLEAGLARTNGKDARAADLFAHLGWLHWMNEKIAFHEFGNAERFFKQALAIDSKNVFGNAFLGNWLLQTNGDSAQAIACFRTALAANKQRALVRRLQLGGLYQNDAPGMRAEFIRALNEVRMNKEPLDRGLRDRLSYLYDPTVTNAAELRETLTAVPVEDAWQTFLWLNPTLSSDYNRVQRDFVQANLAELTGNRPAALAAFKTLAGILKAKHFDGRIATYTADAIQRLAP